MKTHGEAWFERKQNIDLSKDDSYFSTKALPPRMSRKDASRHYNTKLLVYWMNCLDDSMPIMLKAQTISRMMFGDSNRYKMFKEKSL